MTAGIHIVTGHPRGDSLSKALANAYQRGAEGAGAEIRWQDLSGMVFDADLSFGYQQRKTLEPCLEAWRENVIWAGHLAWFYPIWWGSMPGKMKGLVDRCFLPGFAMRYHEKGPWWDKLLEGRTADVMVTADTPVAFDWLAYGRPGKKQVTKQVLGFSVVKVTGYKHFGPVKLAKPAQIEGWIKRAETQGAQAGRK